MGIFEDKKAEEWASDGSKIKLSNAIERFGNRHAAQVTAKPCSYESKTMYKISFQTSKLVSESEKNG